MLYNGKIPYKYYEGYIFLVLVHCFPKLFEVSQACRILHKRKMVLRSENGALHSHHWRCPRSVSIFQTEQTCCKVTCITYSSFSHSYSEKLFLPDGNSIPRNTFQETLLFFLQCLKHVYQYLCNYYMLKIEHKKSSLPTSKLCANFKTQCRFPIKWHILPFRKCSC